MSESNVCIYFYELRFFVRFNDTRVWTPNNVSKQLLLCIAYNNSLFGVHAPGSLCRYLGLGTSG